MKKKYNIRYYALGHSYLSHGPFAGWQTSGRWGMAASSSENDYFSRFQYHLQENLPCNISSIAKNIAEYERICTVSALREDYTSSSIYQQIKEDLQAINPNLITIFVGGGNTRTKDYKALCLFYEVLFSMIRENICEDTIVLCPCSPTCENAANACREWAVKYGFLPVDMSFLFEAGNGDTNPYFAFKQYPEYDKMVQKGAIDFRSHPGDLGHEAIATRCWEKVKEIIPEKMKMEPTLDMGIKKVYTNNVICQSTQEVFDFSKVERWEFDIPEKNDGVVVGGFNIAYRDSCVCASSAIGTGVCVYNISLKLNSEHYDTFRVKMLLSSDEERQKFSVEIATDKADYSFEKAAVNGKMTEYVFDISKVEGTIREFWMRPEMKECYLSLDSIAFENQTEHYIELIKEYSKKNYLQMVREPEGILKNPFIVPGSQSYHNNLWDWDSWLANIAIRQIMKDNGDDHKEFSRYEKGCVLNFLEHTTLDGKMPIFITPSSEFPKLEGQNETNIHKPCLVQHAAFVIAQSDNDFEWLCPFFYKLEAFVDYYMQHMRHEKTGLYFWQDDTAIGVDNDPCTFYRPDRSSASIYLNCLMYKELLAMVFICRLMGKDATKYIQESEHLKDAVNRYLWDERNGFYYSADLNLKPINPEEWLHSGMPRHWDCLIQRIDCWSGFMAMWAGIATPENAQRMVRENLLKPELFYADYGVCTLAKTEKMYCIVKSGNPSCWLGPVWGISNYICYRGLVNYGFRKEAKELANKTIRLFGMDLEKHGELHEYYHPDSGEGINNPGFQNWNLLVNNMIAEITGKEVVTEAVEL